MKGVRRLEIVAYRALGLCFSGFVLNISRAKHVMVAFNVLTPSLSLRVLSR